MFGIKHRKKTEIDMTTGPLFSKILVFTIPVLLSGVLQLLYNAADTITVGKCVGKEALAAVGSTGSLTSLLVGMFIGLSVGTCVALSQSIGGGRGKECSDIVHTSIAISIAFGGVISIIGVFASRPLLGLMNVPDSVIELSSEYMRIIFFGMPAQMIYNYGAAILRAKGDTQHPLYYLIFSGLVNVVLNLFFVIVCGMGVAGVAVATIISQYLSAFLVISLLCRDTGICRLELRKLSIRGYVLKKIIKIGVPAGLQSIVFSISNVIIQSSINFFGDTVMAGDTVASNIDGITYIAMNSFYHAALTFSGQNFGARKFDRIKKTCAICMSMVTVVGVIIGILCRIFGETLLGIYTDDPEVIHAGMVRLLVVGIPYFTCGTMEVMSGMLRGIGSSVASTIGSFAWCCAFRLIWIYTYFQINHKIEILYLSYLISWVLTTLTHFICYKIMLKRKSASPDLTIT